MKLVSIALATYNGEQFIRALLNSLVNQSYELFEICISDDFSTDSTVDIIKEYIKKYPNIKLNVQEKNIGFLKNFETTISMCSGDYIALCDQDDIWELQKIETLVNNIGENSLIFSDAFLIDANSTVINDSYTKFSNICINSSLWNCMIFRKNFVTGCLCMFDAKLKNDLLPFPEYISFHDWWITMWALQRNGVYYINKKLISYRQHSENVNGAEGIRTSSNLLHYILPFKTVYNQKKKEERKRMIEVLSELEVTFIAKQHIISQIKKYHQSFLGFRPHIKTLLLYITNFSLYRDRNKALIKDVLYQVFGL